MASGRRIEHYERWHAVARIGASQSVTDVAVFFDVHHSIISRLRKQFLTSKTVVQRHVAGRPRVAIPRMNPYIVFVAKRIEEQPAYMWYLRLQRLLVRLYCHYCVPKATHEGNVHAFNPSLCSSIY